MNEIQKLNEKRKELLKQGKLAEAVAISKEIEKIRQQREVVPMKEILNEMTEEEKDKARRLMIAMFVYTDLLDSSVTDFLGFLRTFDQSTDILITRQLKVAKNALNEVLRIVDETANGIHSENHGKLCDEVRLVTTNVINKYENLDRKKLKRITQ